jgi:hypothetical protein
MATECPIHFPSLLTCSGIIPLRFGHIYVCMCVYIGYGVSHTLPIAPDLLWYHPLRFGHVCVCACVVYNSIAPGLLALRVEHVCMCVYIFMCLYLCAWVWINMCICQYIYIYIYTHTHIYICTCVGGMSSVHEMYACMYARFHACRQYFFADSCNMHVRNTQTYIFTWNEAQHVCMYLCMYSHAFIAVVGICMYVRMYSWRHLALKGCFWSFWKCLHGTCIYYLCRAVLIIYYLYRAVLVVIYTIL